MIYVKAYIGVLIAFIVLDAIWLGLIAKSLYASQLGEHMRANPNMLVAALFYIFYVAGVVFFAVQPSLASASWWTALLNGAVLGALAYGTYGVTNYAVLNGWPLNLTVADTLWGTALTGVAAVCGYLTSQISFG